MWKYIGLALLLVNLQCNAPAWAYTLGLVVLDGKIKFDTTVCENPPEYELGLGGRKAMAARQAMLFPYFGAEPAPRIFWMKGMLIPLDILWMYKGKIVHIEKNLAPPPLLANTMDTYGTGVAADAVLEIQGGLSDRLGLEEGMSFQFTPQN